MTAGRRLEKGMRVKVRKAGGGQWGAGADSLARGRGGMLVGGAAQEAAQLGVFTSIKKCSLLT